MKNNTNITNASIESAGLPKDYKNAIAEYIWNGFDAKADHIEIQYESNELGYLNNIRIIDNGEGIDYNSLNRSFGNFLDSIKRSSLKRSSYTRGRKGKGRFSFSLFATRATWQTKYLENEIVQEYQIIIDRDQKESYEDSFRIPTPGASTGTTIILEGIFGLTESYLTSEDFLDFLAQEFGWFLFLNKEQNYQIKINGTPISYKHLILENETVLWRLEDNEQKEYKFKVNFIRWKKNIGDRYYYYFLNSQKLEVAKELTSFNNNALDFHHSIYIESSFFNLFQQESLEISRENNLFNDLQQHVILKKLNADLRIFLDRKQKKYVREQVADTVIASIQHKYILPRYSTEIEDQRRKVQIINLLRELCIAQPKVFTSMKTDYLKAYIGFIDLLLQTDKRSEILWVIEQTIPLEDEEKMTLSNILNTTF